MCPLNLERFDRNIITGLLLVCFGFACQVYAAWSIDFAFVTLLRGKPCVEVPFYGACVELGAWWNTHFFLLFPIGAVLLIIGAYILGRTIRKIAPKE